MRQTNETGTIAATGATPYTATPLCQAITLTLSIAAGTIIAATIILNRRYKGRPLLP